MSASFSQSVVPTIEKYSIDKLFEGVEYAVVDPEVFALIESRKDHRPQLSDLRESGAIEQDADIVLFLYRDDYYNKENSEKPGVCEINIAKNRSGPTDTVELTWVARYTKFSDKAI